jgi:hypothetical protein
MNTNFFAASVMIDSTSAKKKPLKKTANDTLLSTYTALRDCNDGVKRKGDESKTNRYKIDKEY